MSREVSTPTDGRVRRRRVFYIPGFDPFPTRRYRELYRREAAEQARISGYEIAITAAAPDAPASWQVTARMEGSDVASTVEVLVWSDLVKQSMGATIPATYLALFRTVSIYLVTGAFFRLMLLRKGPVIAALYPVVVLLAQGGLALLLGYLVAGVVAEALRDWLPVSETGPGAFGPWLVAVLAGGALVALVLRLGKRLDRHLFAHYLMQDFEHAARHKGATPPALAKRLGAFSDRIDAALADPVDEVLVVGHSSGAHLGVMVLADLIRSGRVRPEGPALAFLSLGHVVPMVSFLPAARQLRRDLHDLSQSACLTWVDVTAPGDGCAFALCDPVAVSGVAPRAGKHWPLVLSAAFSQTLSAARQKALRGRFHRLHFQYLCAFDQPGDYDYFRITAGPLTLGARFRGRKPSASRIEIPVNRFTDMA